MNVETIRFPTIYDKMAGSEKNDKVTPRKTIKSLMLRIAIRIYKTFSDAKYTFGQVLKMGQGNGSRGKELSDKVLNNGSGDF